MDQMADSVSRGVLESLINQMADSVTRGVLESLINLIKDEANLLSGVKDQVKLLQGDLGFMNAFLKNSAGKQNENPVVKELVNQIRDVALEAEDVIETDLAKIIEQSRRKRLRKLFNFPSHVKLLHDVANKTSSIKNKVENIYQNKEIYHIGEAAESSVDAEEAERSLHQRRRNVEEDDVVGFINDTTTLVNQLTDPGSLQLKVISIIGMGGLGKTTLARKIYNTACVKIHFHFCAWISVSQEYKMNRLLLDILKCIGVPISDEINEKSDEELNTTLCENLKGKRYFVVMDDIWKTQVWDEIRGAFPNETNGSRILITSREKEVASHASPTPPYFLPFLDNQASWELLHKKVFRGEECPSYLESQGKQLAESCKGLPLSIVVLGGILANKEKSPRIWSKFVGHVNSYLTEDRTRCLDILALSYNNLPHKLKPCFLYLGMFPEDYEIRAQELIQLWIAERLVQQIGNRKVDDVAEDYLEELIDRSLIQVASRRTDRSVDTCRTHDLLRDFCIKESNQEKFLEFRSEANLSSCSNARRLSIHGDPQQYVIRNARDTSSARSLLLFCQRGYFRKEQWKWVCKGFKFIRVLRLVDVHFINSFPKAIRKLIFLRHLSIRVTHYSITKEARIVADYLSNLPYLETIDIQIPLQDIPSCAPPVFLQRSIWKMKQLRHLNVDSGFIIRPERGNNQPSLCNLQAVHSMKVDKNTALYISKFPNLTELTLWNDDTDNFEVVEAVLESLENLQHLQRLQLHRFNSFPHSKLPSTLTKVTLSETRDYSNIMKMLGQLPNLCQLSINSGKNHVELKVIAGQFPQLQVLEWLSDGTIKLELDGDALMPNLQHLVIINYSDEANVDIDLPDQLWCIKALQSVKLEVSDRLVDVFKRKLRKLKCVRDVERDMRSLGSGFCELTLNNGCQVLLGRK